MSTSSLRPLAHGAILLCLAISLTACRSGPIVRTQTVEVRVPVVVPLDPKLTAMEPKPARPAAACRDDKGPVLCNGALASWLRAYDAALARVNGRVSAIRKLQPEGK